MTVIGQENSPLGSTIASASLSAIMLIAALTGVAFLTGCTADEEPSGTLDSGIYDDAYSSADAAESDDIEELADTAGGAPRDTSGGDERDAQEAPDASGQDINGADIDAPELSFECPEGMEVNDGWNTVTLDGEERRYHVDLPADPAERPSMIFAFHGFSGPVPPTEDTEQFRDLLKDQVGLLPDARADFPFILVLMEDTNLQPFEGLDWDIRTDSPNVDIPYFEAIVACLAEHQDADTAKVFGFGFSAGATILNLIHSKHPELLRAIISESGLWANEEENLKIALEVTLGLPLIDWDWPELEVIAPGEAAILLTRGGPDDLVPGSPAPASLDSAGEFARDWLKEHGRLVIDCPHQGGHTLHSEILSETILDFFSAHQAPGESPLMSEPLDSLPAGCEVSRP